MMLVFTGSHNISKKSVLQACVYLETVFTASVYCRDVVSVFTVYAYANCWGRCGFVG